MVAHPARFFFSSPFSAADFGAKSSAIVVEGLQDV